MIFHKTYYTCDVCAAVTWSKIVSSPHAKIWCCTCHIDTTHKRIRHPEPVPVQLPERPLVMAMDRRRR